MRIAVVVGGWHWPITFFRQMLLQPSGLELFVVSHRSPELPVVREEKVDILATAVGPLADLDRMLYEDFPTIDRLRGMGWNYEEAPNTIGDWGFFNQWLERHPDYDKYDIILNCHDDTYIHQDGLFDQLGGDWLILGNGRYPEAPDCYVRGSFEFWKPELLNMLGGRIDLGNVKLTREGKTDSPEELSALSEWNKTAVPLRNFMIRRGLKRVKYLSEYYRVSPWVIEGERGFMHKMGGAPWSFKAGLRAHTQLENK